MKSIGLLSLLILAACSSEARPPKPAEPVDAAPGATTSAAIATGPETTLRPEASSDTLQWAASVARVDALDAADAKLFGLAGGDPALNGLQTYLAFFLSPADGWRVFSLGDWRDYRIVSQGPGVVTIGFTEDVLAGDQTTIAARAGTMTVRWAAGGEAPAAVTTTASTAG